MTAQSVKLNPHNPLRKIVEGAAPEGMFEHALAGALGGLSIPYGLVAKGRVAAYRAGLLPSRRLPLPVICIGNLTVGGTGKTPVTAAVARALLNIGERPAIISRGYGATMRKADELAVVSDGRGTIAPIEVAGDEPHLLSRMLPAVPIVACADRYRAGLAAIDAFSPSVIVMDDGFQHRRLYRDIDFVLVDVSRAPSQMKMFPRGPLRESFEALSRASLIGLTRFDQSAHVEAWQRIVRDHAPGVPSLPIVFKSAEVVIQGEAQSLASLAGRTVYAYCGIGNPDAFLETVRATGAILKSASVFADHHQYTVEDLRALASRAASVDAGLLLTTDKDAAKIPVTNLPSMPMAILRIEAVFDLSPLLDLLAQKKKSG